jgi:hypothetical protein
MKTIPRIWPFTWRAIIGAVILSGVMVVEYCWTGIPPNIRIGVFTLTGCCTGSVGMLAVGCVVEDLRNFKQAKEKLGKSHPHLFN